MTTIVFRDNIMYSDSRTSCVRDRINATEKETIDMILSACNFKSYTDLNKCADKIYTFSNTAGKLYKIGHLTFGIAGSVFIKDLFIEKIKQNNITENTNLYDLISDIKFYVASAKNLSIKILLYDSSTGLLHEFASQKISYFHKYFYFPRVSKIKFIEVYRKKPSAGKSYAIGSGSSFVKNMPPLLTKDAKVMIECISNHDIHTDNRIQYIRCL